MVGRRCLNKSKPCSTVVSGAKVQRPSSEVSHRLVFVVANTITPNIVYKALGLGT